MTALRIAWPAGLLASALINAGALAVLAAFLAPAPLPEPPRPETELEVTAYRLDRTRAEETAPQADPATPAEARGDTAPPGAIPVSRGRPAPPP